MNDNQIDNMPSLDISPESLERFRRVYIKVYKNNPSDVKLLEVAQRLLSYIALIYRPLPPDGEVEK